MRGVLGAINAVTAPLARRARLAVRRGIVKLVYDNPKMQELQLAIFSGEIRDHVERWEEYGITSHPFPEAEALVLALGGNAGHSAVVCVADRRYRLTALAEGEVALYDDQGQVIHLKRDKTVHIYGSDHLVADIGIDTTLTCPTVTVAAATKVSVTTPIFEVTAATKVVMTTPLLEVTGAITGGTNITATSEVRDAAGTKSMSGMRSTYNSHTHVENTLPGSTNTPTQGM